MRETEKMIKAADFEARRLPIEAAKAYEEILKSSEATLDCYLNLAVLYFASNDYGFEVSHGLSPQFVAFAFQRMFEVLDEAEYRFGQVSDILFWRKYFKFIIFGEELSIEEVKQMARYSKSLVPYFHLCVVDAEEVDRDVVRRLFEIVRNGDTELKRYVKGILESRLD
ncbi:MAG: hypothetical protein KF881_13200 [Acidobacteria bacterium]|nr:hypothetical protein [Acidobacteriota bacterium]